MNRVLCPGSQPLITTRFISAMIAPNFEVQLQHCRPDKELCLSYKWVKALLAFAVLQEGSGAQFHPSLFSWAFENTMPLSLEMASESAAANKFLHLAPGRHLHAGQYHVISMQSRRDPPQGLLQVVS